MPQSATVLEKEPYLRALLMGRAKAGKAQPLDEPVLTPSGWSTMGALRVGDEVIGSDGMPTQVIAVHPQGVKKVVRIKTGDGAWTRCCEDHLWLTETRRELARGRWVQGAGSHETRKQRFTGRWGAGSVKTTREIRTDGRTHFLPEMSGPVCFLEGPELTFDPYFLGLLIGDGSFTEALGGVRFTSQDKELLEAFGKGAEALGDEAVLYDKEERCPWIRVRGTRTATLLKSLGLYGCRSETKFAPGPILTASPDDRLAFIQGLFDTDGYACIRDNADGQASQAEYCSTSKALAKAVVELIRGLGGRARLRYKEETKSQSGPGLPAWIVMAGLESACPFRLRRKADVWGIERQRKWRPRITEITDDGEAECVCITIDAPDALYVTRGHMLTHNSTCTIVSLSTIGPGYVLCCGDKSGMAPAARRTKLFSFDIVRDENDMEACLKEARRGVKDGDYKWLFVDDFSLYASFLEGALRDASASQNKSGEPDGRRYWPEFKSRLLNIPRRMFDAKAHVVFTSHFIEGSPEIDGQRSKTGTGIVPMIGGSSREELPALFQDVIFMEREKDGRRVFQVNPEGVWGPGCRSVDGTSTIDADFGVFLKLAGDSYKKAATGGKR